MTSMRIKRVNSLLLKNISKTMSKHSFSDEFFCTVTKVDTSPDLRYSDVFLSIYPENKTGSALKAIEKQLPSLKKDIFSDLTMRILPRIRLHADPTERNAQKVESILKSIHDQENERTTKVDSSS